MVNSLGGYVDFFPNNNDKNMCSFYGNFDLANNIYKHVLIKLGSQLPYNYHWMAEYFLACKKSAILAQRLSTKNDSVECQYLVRNETSIGVLYCNQSRTANSLRYGSVSNN